MACEDNDEKKAEDEGLVHVKAFLIYILKYISTHLINRSAEHKYTANGEESVNGCREE